MKTKSGKIITNPLELFIAQYITHDIEPNSMGTSDKLSSFLTAFFLMVLLVLITVLLGNFIIAIFKINKKFESLFFMSALLFVGGVFNDISADYYNNIEHKTKNALKIILKFFVFALLSLLIFFGLEYKNIVVTDPGFEYWIIYLVLVIVLWISEKLIKKFKR